MTGQTRPAVGMRTRRAAVHSREVILSGDFTWSQGIGMSRVWMLGALTLVALGCRNYDFYDPIASQRGLVPATQYSRYGAEQAEAMQIARSLGQWRGGSSIEDRATM